MEQNQITKIAWDLNEKTPNRYELVYQIAELAKRMIDEAQMRKPLDDFGDYESAFDPDEGVNSLTMPDDGAIRERHLHAFRHVLNTLCGLTGCNSFWLCCSQFFS